MWWLRLLVQARGSMFDAFVGDIFVSSSFFGSKNLRLLRSLLLDRESATLQHSYSFRSPSSSPWQKRQGHSVINNAHDDTDSNETIAPLWNLQLSLDE